MPPDTQSPLIEITKPVSLPISSIDTYKFIKDAQEAYEKNDAKKLYDLIFSTVASLANTALLIGIALESLTKNTN